MERWRGKVAIVTGASAGIGAAIAQKLVEEGLIVAGMARRKNLVEEMALKLAGKPGKLCAFEVDITNEESIVKSFKEIEDSLGPIHVLVNNAGVAKKNTIVDGDTELWRQVLDTNVLGLTICSREGIRSMMAHKIDGHIININSVAGHKVNPIPFSNIYPASKHAVTALTENLRYELKEIGQKIKTTSLSPGFVETEIVKVGGFLDNPEMAALVEKAPALKSEDIANAVLYVLGTPPSVQIAELIIKPLGELF